MIDIWETTPNNLPEVLTLHFFTYLNEITLHFNNDSFQKFALVSPSMLALTSTMKHP